MTEENEPESRTFNRASILHNFKAVLAYVSAPERQSGLEFSELESSEEGDTTEMKRENPDLRKNGPRNHAGRFKYKEKEGKKNVQSKRTEERAKNLLTKLVLRNQQKRGEEKNPPSVRRNSHFFFPSDIETFKIQAEIKPGDQVEILDVEPQEVSDKDIVPATTEYMELHQMPPEKIKRTVDALNASMGNRQELEDILSEVERDVQRNGRMRDEGQQEGKTEKAVQRIKNEAGSKIIKVKNVSRFRADDSWRKEEDFRSPPLMRQPSIGLLNLRNRRHVKKTRDAYSARARENNDE